MKKKKVIKKKRRTRNTIIKSEQKFYRIECASKYHIHGQHYLTKEDALEDVKIVGCKGANIMRGDNITEDTKNEKSMV